MIFELLKKRKSQSLIELIISITLAVVFLTAFVVNLAYITNNFNDYQQKYFAYLLNTEQKKINDRNVAYFLANNLITSNYASNNYFANQGSHLSYTYLNYESITETSTFKNQEKTYFLNDDYIYYWSLDSIPTSTTYILDDKGSTDRQGTLACGGSSCSNPSIIDTSKGRCLSNNCLQFLGTASTASEINFPTMSELNSNASTETTWEAWVYTTDATKDQVFMSRGDYNYFGIVSSYPTVKFKIGSSEVTLASPDTISSSQWYHMVATFNGANIKLYINGEIKATSSNYSGVLGTSDNLKFGYFKSDSLLGFVGYLDEVKIYKRDLTDNEILNRYRGFRKQMGLIANWHFDDALNVATYTDASETGLNPRFVSFSSPDNVPVTIEKAKAENNPLSCKSGACPLFYRDYSSKGTLTDAGNVYTQLHNLDHITISTHLKLTEINSDYQGIFGKDVNGNYALGLYNNDIRVALNIDGTRYTETYDANLAINTWYQIDFTYDGSDMKLYIDGVLKQTWNHSGEIEDDTNHGSIYLGYSGASNEYLDGIIDELRIYNRALSSDEINNYYDGSYTQYQYFKPICKVSDDGTVSSECLNCNPINGTECTRAISGNNYEPFLIRSINVVKYGKGINYKEIKNDHIIPVVNNFYQQEAGPNIWGGGYTVFSGTSCGRFVFGSEGFSSDTSVKYNSACGDPTCGREIVGAQTCASDNISYYYSNGCTTCSGTPGSSSWTCDACTADGYFEKTDGDQSAYFISPTFNFPKKMGLISLGWVGSSGPVKFQLACLNEITDGSGNELPEETWNYLGPDPLNPKRCIAGGYYSGTSDSLISASSCWESDNQALYNCQFFRFKVLIDAGVTPTVNSIRLNFGQYPYTIIK